MSLPERVFHALLDDVLGGRYSPGERLPTQRALAGDLGVNMASVREGIKRLEQLRLVDVRHGDAMRVRDWRVHGGLDVLAYAATDPQVLAPLFEARRLLLREAARLAAGRRTDEQAAALAGLAAAIAAADDDGEAQRLDFAFFAVVVEAAGNLVFTLIMNSIREAYLPRLELFRAIVGDRAYDAALYRRAARAIAARDAGRAAGAVERLAAAQEARILR